jgi:hypothetical protein
MDLYRTLKNSNINKPEDHAESRGFSIETPFDKNNKFKK